MSPTVQTAPMQPGKISLLCFHYLGGSAREWSVLASHLDPFFHLMAIDLPGFGDASSLSSYSVEAMLEHVMRIAIRRPYRPFVLVGHSMGAKVAAILARRAEDGADGLEGLMGLVHVAGSPPSPEPMDDTKRARMLAMLVGDDRSRAQDAARYVDENSGHDFTGPLRQVAVDDALRCSQAAWRAWLQSGSKEDWSSRVGVLQTSALIITGETDNGLGATVQQRVMAPHLAHCRAVDLTGAGHLLPLERPKELAALISAHVARSSHEAVSAVNLPSQYAALITSSRVGADTRDALNARLAPNNGTGPINVFDEEQLQTLRAVLNCVLPQSENPIDLVSRIEQLLAQGQGDGWRPAALPADPAAYCAGLGALNEHARAEQVAGFAALGAARQHAVLQQVANGLASWASGRSPHDEGLDAAALKAWFEDLRADAVRLYMAHPATLARIGYSGIANGGDGTPKSGFVQLGVGAREAWEPISSRDATP